jgi:hypothetical protein
MKKLLLLIGLLFLVTGCEATYTITLGDNDINENIKILERNNVISSSDVSKELDEIIVSNSDETMETGFYTFNKLLAADKSGIEMNYKFDPANQYELYSTFLRYCYDDVSFVYDALKIKLVTNSSFKCYNTFNTLNKLTIEIITPYKVVTHNADAVDGQSYMWFIDKDDTGKIIFEADKTEASVDDESIMDNSGVQFIIVAVVFIILPSAIALYVYFKYLQLNKI